jgi:hypothetical protein
MFFTKLGRVLAWIALVGGALQVAMGFYVALTFTSREGMVAASKRYLGTTSSGEAINGGVELLAIGVVIGILAEISLRSGGYRQPD